MNFENMVTAIRQKSNSLPATLNPELDEFAREARIVQLHGMLELLNLMSNSDIKVPAMIAGSIQSEIERLNQQGETQ